MLIHVHVTNRHAFGFCYLINSCEAAYFVFILCIAQVRAFSQIICILLASSAAYV